MTYLDKIGHLISSTSLTELHQFAKKIGLKPYWFQDHKHPHYDLTTERKRQQAIEAGATLISSKELVKLLPGRKMP